MVFRYFLITNNSLDFSTILKTTLKFLDFIINKFFIVINSLLNILNLRTTQKNTTQCHIEPIYALILVVEKDIALLTKCIDGLIDNCLNPILKIVVISPDSDKIKSICILKNVDWLDEKHLEPVSKDFIFEHYKKSKKIGWIYQQCLKLNIDTIFGNANCLIVDVDTIFLQKQHFIINNKYVLKTSDEYHILYRKINQTLLNTKDIKWKSFIAHHQIISTFHLSLLKQKIETNSKENFWKFLLSEIASNDGWFSEYELYGNYMNLFHRDKIELRYWNNYNSKNLRVNKLNLEKISKKYCSISLHNYDYEIYTA